jgi:hypothetical protein
MRRLLLVKGDMRHVPRVGAKSIQFLCMEPAQDLFNGLGLGRYDHNKLKGLGSLDGR